MQGWKEALKDTLHHTSFEAEKEFDKLRSRLQKRLKRTDPVIILPYRGFGTEKVLRLKGRVLEDEGLSEATEHDTVWENILNMYRRFESDELPGVRVRAQYGSVTQDVVTDEEGYFEIEIHPVEPLPVDRYWHEVELELLDDVSPGGKPVRATGEVLVAPSDASFGVISDVDDTVLQTGAARLLDMAQQTFLQNARTRLPFEGVAAFYRALQGGPDGSGHNPIFYVSSSPWNLYDFLVDFFDGQAIPHGPFLLRDLGIDADKFIKSGHSHKLDKIESILSTYPGLSFILVGDTGQEDPELYRKAIEQFPDHIKAVYLRDVADDVRDAEVRKLAEEAHTFDVPMLLIPDTEAAAVHAAESGFIDPAELPNIRAEKAKDEVGKQEEV